MTAYVCCQVSEEAVRKRHSQGWLTEVCSDLDDCIARIRKYRASKTAVSIGYHGNVVDLWYMHYL